MPNPSVFLHGRSVISALGANINQALDAIQNQRSCCSRIILPDGSQYPYFQLEFKTEAWQEKCSRLVKQAIHEAFPPNKFSVIPKDIPLIIASSSVNLAQMEQAENLKGISCQDFAEQIKAYLAWEGAVYLIPVACSASTQAMLMAKQFIASGAADDVLVLGIELINRVTVSGFATMSLLSETSAQPCGAKRDGMVLGEAVSALHLSKQESRWQILGGASMVSGASPTGTTPELVKRICDYALKNSRLTTESIDLIKLQAAGSIQNDATEISGLNQLFAELPALSTLKHLIGHALGASGMCELILLITCLEQGIKPYYQYELDLSLQNIDHLFMLPKNVRHILALTLGFGGEHTAIIVKDNKASTK